MPTTVPLADRPWPGLDVSASRILVAGFGVSGYAVVDQTLQRGAHVVAVDASTSEDARERARILGVLGADIRLGPEHTAHLPAMADGGSFDVVVTSPGWRPDQPLLREAAQQGIPIWSEIELARRMQPPGGPAWLAVTGTNGKTTVVSMLEQMLRAAGLRAVAAGNVGLALIEAVLDPRGYDVIALELSSFQLHWSTHIHAHASAILNVSDDHVDWHGSALEYAKAKGKIFEGTQIACLYNLHDPATRTLLENADVAEGCRAIGVGVSAPGPSEIGRVEDILVDRAFLTNRAHQALELGSLADVAAPAAPHMVLNALFAAGLARSIGVSPHAIRDGLRAFRPQPHRSVPVAQRLGATWINDSKATNPDSASAALSAARDVVWIAGGDTKGADLEPVIARHADRLRAVVLIGRDPEPYLAPLAEHAPRTPVHWVDPSALEPLTDVMSAAVRQAADFVRSLASRTADGDSHEKPAIDDLVVLLAPAAASIDQFANYAERGDAFAQAVRTLEETPR